MHIIETVEELRKWRKTAGRVAFVPTMGNLHEGHLSLVERAKQEATHIVVSIFVNRIQFGAGEDFDRYPRTFEQDAAALRTAGVSVLFAPNEQELYPNGVQSYFVDPPELQNELCGAFRPGHFRGVATVVTKLFNIVQPDVACFGTKDFQQLAIIRGMVTDLNLPVHIIGVPVARAANGLALSSRNQYLSDNEHEQAVFLYRQLGTIADELKAGNRDFAALEQAANNALTQQGWRVDYVSIRDSGSLKIPQSHSRELVVLAAAHLGNTRLIDNIEVSLD